ncbi:MAG: squalene synthase HpnC [Rhodocyclales bacterium CG17_big_fil_post_rev_8_21_14_2_50_68_7]|nr:MAG: squalene synthase HpnC [Rhodocyclales bacterium CG17_big_fil_post_rev_8_21_14_2_50_68_7]
MPVAHYENFPVASRLLPRKFRAPVEAIYRFARAADDIADEGDASPAERLEALARYAGALDAIERGEPAGPEPFAALAAAVRAHRLPLQPLRDLLDAFAQDVTKTRYRDQAELMNYCRRSANPVGRLLLHLYGMTDATSIERSDAICTGLQLTNFWQDVESDWRRGRLYLPIEDLERFGVSEAQIAQGRCDDRFRALLLHEIGQARALLLAGAPLARAAAGRIALELRMTVAGGLRVLERIERTGCDVFRHRPRLGPLDWTLMLWRAAAHARR